jgi:hypothetical protein
MTTATQARNARFQRGSGVYTCRSCNHDTRDTGGDGAGVQLCDLCFDLAGEENHVSDNGGTTYESAENVGYQLAALDRRNGVGTARRVFPTVCDAVAYA